MKSRWPRPVQRTQYLAEVCRGQRVLHLGCTDAPYTQQRVADGMLLHSRLADVTSELWGMDADEAGLGELQNAGFRNLVLGDVEALEDASIGGTFDTVVAGEIIEHLSNPGLFLDGVSRFLGPNSSLVLTTVNAYCAMRFFVSALLGRGGDVEPVHPDHVAYYSRATLGVALARSNLAVEEMLFYDLGDEHRPFVSWRLRLLNDAAVRFAPQLADGVIARCRRVE